MSKNASEVANSLHQQRVLQSLPMMTTSYHSDRVANKPIQRTVLRAATYL